MKPKVEKFKDTVEKHGGNVTQVAKSLGVSRKTVQNWIKSDNAFKDIVDDARGGLFDDCLSTARVVALGIPDVQGGKMVGWIERPDSGMLRYLISVLGRKEGWGEHVDVTTNGKDIGGINLFRVLTKNEVEEFDKTFDEEC